MKVTITKVLVFGILAVALVGLGRWSAPADHGEAGDEPATADATIWTCPMHAQIRLPEPVPCPICGMDLVRLDATDDLGPFSMSMSEAAVRLASIRTTPVRLGFVTHPVRMTGKLDYDETSIKRVSAWVAGRLERMFVDYTGVDVAEGEHLFELYSPDLLTAQEELLSAAERLRTSPGDASEFLARSSKRLYQGAREKLLLLGLSEAQVAEIEERGHGVVSLTLHSPVTGTVIEKHLDEGAYVATGTPVYTIADLSRLWVRLDAYEQDLAWLRFGQKVSLQTEALPGETFEGTISFIDPVVHERHRTTKVRVNVPNPDGRLKPGMFVRAVTLARLGSEGAVLPPDLAGKWISPMHPEIVRDEPGDCDVCGMPLVPAEELAFSSGNSAPAQALVVPASAVLVTGRRSVVYVEVPGTERPTYEGREVLLGPRAGDEYIIRQGLSEGERVVAHGAFRIDSSMQIRAKRSMLSMPAESPGGGAGTDPFRGSLEGLYRAYLALGRALADDDESAAIEAAAQLPSALDAARPSLAPREVLRRWESERPAIAAAVEVATQAPDIASMRAAFAPLSRAILAMASGLGVPRETVWHEAFCPMAFENTGAPWLQESETIANPYFGSAMLRCGEIRRTFVGTDGIPGAGSADESVQPEPVDGPDAALFHAYLAIQSALAADRVASEEQMQALEEAARGDAVLTVSAAAMIGAADIEAQRVAFWPLSQALIARAARQNVSGMPLFEVHCSMAFDFEGASWLSSKDEVLNPYFGSEMPTCGSVKRTFEVAK